MPGTRTQICLFLSDSSKVALSSDSVFGHMLHEWTCTDVRLWFDYEDRAEPKPYRIVEQTEGEWLIEIAGEAPDLDVVALADDHDVVAVAREGSDRPMRDANQRTGRLDDGQPQSAGASERPLRRPMRGHHHRRRLDLCDVLRDRDALRLEGGQDGGVVNEVAQNRDGSGVGVLGGERDGVANAETHAEVAGADKPHTLP